METTSLKGALGLYSFKKRKIQPIKVRTWDKDHSAMLNAVFASFFSPQVSATPFDDAEKTTNLAIKTNLSDKKPVEQAFLNNSDKIHRKDLKSAFLALGVGPGRWTGTRVGVSFAKTLNFVSQVPIYPVSSLKILAESQSDQSTPILVLMNGFQNSLYMALYQKKQGQLKEILSPSVVLPKDLPDLIKTDCLCVGDGYEVYKSCWSKKFKSQLKVKSNTFPEIHYLARLMNREFTPSQFTDWKHLSPVYLRSPVPTLKVS